MDPDDGTPGKRPPAPSAPRQTVTLLLRKMRVQARLEGLNPDIWAEDDYAIVDPDINKRVGRIYPELIKGEPMWLWFLQTEPAPPPNSGKAGSLEKAKAAFKRRRGGRDERHHIDASGGATYVAPQAPRHQTGRRGKSCCISTPSRGFSWRSASSS